jgi:methyl-accepting chemotaxis protein
MIPERPKMETRRYLSEAAAAIDEEFGEGYAAAHPELVGAFIGACATEDAAKYQGEWLKDVAEGIEEVGKSIYHIAEMMDPSGLKEVAEAVKEAASMIGSVATTLEAMPEQYGGLHKIAEAIGRNGKEAQHG